MMILESITNNSDLNKFDSQLEDISNRVSLNSRGGCKLISGSAMLSLIQYLLENIDNLRRSPKNLQYLFKCYDEAKSATDTLREDASKLESAAEDASKLLEGIKDYLQDMEESENAKTDV